MTEQASRRGAVEMGTVLMIVAFAVIAGFLYWLNGQAAEERAQTQIMEDSLAAMEENDPYADAIPISGNDIAMGAGGYEGQLVRLAPQTVVGLVGQQGFFLELATGPFLVSMSDELRADSLGIASEDVVRVTGRVQAMSDSIAAEWQEAGTISEGEALAVTVGTHFIAAEQIDVSAPPPEDDSAGSNDGGA